MDKNLIKTATVKKTGEKVFMREYREAEGIYPDRFWVMREKGGIMVYNADELENFS